MLHTLRLLFVALINTQILVTLNVVRRVALYL